MQNPVMIYSIYDSLRSNICYCSTCNKYFLGYTSYRQYHTSIPMHIDHVKNKFISGLAFLNDSSFIIAIEILSL